MCLDSIIMFVKIGLELQPASDDQEKQTGQPKAETLVFKKQSTSR